MTINFMMTKTLLILWMVFSLNSVLLADESDIKAKLLQQLSGVISNLSQANIHKTSVVGLYEIVLGSEIIYVSADGQFLVQGDIYDIKAGKNITQNKKDNAVSGLLNSIPDNDKIIFKAEKEQYAIHVFTDVDCPYCQKLHKEIPKLNEHGISVKYLASPLAQLHPTALAKMKAIWCAGDGEARKKALDRYKKTRLYKKASCPNSQVVEQQLALAEQLGVRGTPSIFLSSGANIAGYVPAERLIAQIKKITQ